MGRADLRRRKELNSIAVIGNSLPRQCGIATFTTDLANALTAEAPHATCSTVAMTDIPEGYPYPDLVRFEIAQNRLDDYRQAAEYLNVNHIDAVYLQHEYGIFGGQSGSHIISLLDDLHMPVITTLHTILKDPTSVQKDVLIRVCEASDRVVSMSVRGIEFLKSVYGVPEEKICFVHHGIPDIPFVDPNYYKDLFGVEGKKVILTFGLLSDGKGIESVIEALPEIVERHPDVAYIILGATHPNVRKHSGESYRLKLRQMAMALGVDDHVIFQNRFVELPELCEFLGCADLYVTPYCNEAQIVSGTLAYAMGAGKPIISTPYWYAQEMLAEDRGRLVPFGDAKAIARQAINLLDNDVERHAIRKRAYTFTREAVWSDVGRQYIQIFDEARQERIHHPQPAFHARTLRVEAVELADLPELRLDHLMRMTDDTGMLQHAKYSVPDLHHGYCSDDNARALIVAVLAGQLMPAYKGLDDLAARYLAFLHHAFDPKTGHFRNFLGYDRRWLEEIGSEDSHGRAIWGLGVAVGHLEDLALISLASNLLRAALPVAERLTAPRAWAFTLIGIHAYLRRYSGDRDARRVRQVLAEKLLSLFQENATDDWLWFENHLTYANGRLSHALLLSGQWMQRGDMTECGLRSLEWLTSKDFSRGYFAPVGNRGWHFKKSERARFDQQPIEALSVLDACIEAFNITRDHKWVERALGCFNWFLGSNDFQTSLYCDQNGGCCDGLEPDGVNENQGAESTLSWLLSLSVMRMFQTEQVLESRRKPVENREQRD